MKGLPKRAARQERNIPQLLQSRYKPWLILIHNRFSRICPIRSRFLMHYMIDMMKITSSLITLSYDWLFTNRIRFPSGPMFSYLLWTGYATHYYMISIYLPLIFEDNSSLVKTELFKHDQRFQISMLISKFCVFIQKKNHQRVHFTYRWEHQKSSRVIKTFILGWKLSPVVFYR